MLHAGSKSTLRNAAKAVQLEFQLSFWDDLDYLELCKEVESKKRS